MASSVKKRKDYLDIAKGVSMLWIISVHADGAPYTGNIGYTLLIPLFFLTAGYLWKDKDEPYLGQLKKRSTVLLRSYFGYNLLLFIPYLIDCASTALTDPVYTEKQIIKHIIGIFYSEGVINMHSEATSLHWFTPYNYPLWFLTAMVTASAAFLLMLYLRRKFGWKLWWMILPGLVITVAVNHLPIRLPWNASNMFLAAALMAAGYLMRQKDLFDRPWSNKYLEFGAYVLAAAAVTCIGYWNHAIETSMLMSAYGPHGDWGVFIYFIGGCIGPCVLLRLCRFLEGKKLGHIFLVMGQNTIPILALHRTIIVYYNRIWYHFTGFWPELDTPTWFVFTLPRLLIAAAGSMGLLFLGRKIKAWYLARRASGT